MLSSRYASAICIALLVALLPTIIHSYAGVVIDDGRTTSSIPTTLSSYDSVPTRRSVDWGERHFESKDWFEREYSSTGDSLILTVVRSFDLKALYHHPENAVSYHAVKFDRITIQNAEARPDIPIHVLTNRAGSAVGLYALHYDDRFIADPIRFQLRTATELLFSGRQQMTLFFVLDQGIPSGVAPLELPAARLLFDAIDRFLPARSAP